MTKSLTRWLGLLSISVVALSTILPQAQAAQSQNATSIVKVGTACAKAGAAAVVDSTYNAVCVKKGSKLAWAKAPLKEVVLGALDDLTGPAAAIGTLAEKSVKIGVAAMNKAGGMHGYKIKLVFYDTKSDPATTATLGMRLITQDKAVSIICCASSSTVAALSAISGRYKVPVLGVSQLQDLTSPLQNWYGYLFRIAPDNNSLALYNTNFALKKGWKKIALATSSLAYGTAGIPYFKSVITAGGGTVVAEVTLASTITDASVQAAQIIAAKPDVVMSWDYPVPVAQLTKALRSAGSDIPIVSNWSAINDAMTTIAGNLATNLYAHDTADPTNKFIPAFQAQWKAAYNQEAPMSDFSVYGYTGAQIFAAAVKGAKTTDAAGIASSLEKLKCVYTVMGTPNACFSFAVGDYEGANKAADGVFAVMKQLVNGVWKIIS